MKQSSLTIAKWFIASFQSFAAKPQSTVMFLSASQISFVTGEMTPCLDDIAQPSIDTFDRVGGADYRGIVGGERKKGNHMTPGALLKGVESTLAACALRVPEGRQTVRQAVYHQALGHGRGGRLAHFLQSQKIALNVGLRQSYDV